MQIHVIARSDEKFRKCNLYVTCPGPLDCRVEASIKTRCTTIWNWISATFNASVAFRFPSLDFCLPKPRGGLFPSKAWLFPSKAWLFTSQAWLFPSQAWLFPSQAWLFPSQAWLFTSQACKVMCQTARTFSVGCRNCCSIWLHVMEWKTSERGIVDLLANAMVLLYPYIATLPYMATLTLHCYFTPLHCDFTPLHCDFTPAFHLAWQRATIR